MDRLPRELREVVFAPLLGLAPVLEFVCHAWRALVRAERSPPLRVLGLEELAAQGLQPLLVWARSLRRAGFGWPIATRLVIAAAARGHEPIVRFLLSPAERFGRGGSGW